MILLRILLIPFILSFYVGNPFLKSNEEAVYSFKTASGKKVMLARDKEGKYLVYRFGTKDSVEFEYPSSYTDSWSKFNYSFYLRGGGPSNSGMDLNYVYFVNGGYEYVIYDTYFAEEERSAIGIKVIDLKTKKTTDIKGVLKSKVGTLINFRDSKELKNGDETFD